MTWIFVGAYILMSMYVFRRIMYFAYVDFSHNGRDTLDGEDWCSACILAFMFTVIAPFTFIGLICYTTYKTCRQRGITIPSGVLMSVPRYEKAALKQKQRERELNEREQRIARLEKENGIA